MFAIACSFVVGIVLLVCLPVLPSTTLLLLLSVISILLYWLGRRCQLFFSCFWILFGFVWASWITKQQLSLQIPEKWLHRPVIIKGIVDSFPKYYSTKQQFVVAVNELQLEKQAIHRHFNALVSRYHGVLPVVIGQQVSLPVFLSTDHGLLNPGGVDYQRWLFSRRIHVLATVDMRRRAVLVQPQPNLLSGWRQHIAKQINNSGVQKDVQGLIQALIIGVRGQIDSGQRQVLQQTGTSHLLAISGLHIGLLATLVFWLTLRLGAQLPVIINYISLPQLAAITAIMAVLLYSGLAGFALPTQRALLMLALFMLAIVSQRYILAWHSWSCALLLVTIYDPLSVLNVGFWLSFTAVAWLIFYRQVVVTKRQRWQHWYYVQYVLIMGMMPLNVYFFQRQAMYAWLANIIAVPLVGFVVVPLCLFAVLLDLIMPGWASSIFQLAAWFLNYLLKLLAWILTLPSAVHYHAAVDGWVLMLAMLGVWILLCPPALPARWLGLIALLPLVLNPKLPEQTLQMTVLDVHKGLLCVLRTHHHSMVIDIATGRYDQQVLPRFERSVGMQTIDKTIKDRNQAIRACQQRLAWGWDGIDFRWHPIQGPQHQHFCGFTATIGAESFTVVGPAYASKGAGVASAKTLIVRKQAQAWQRWYHPHHIIYSKHRSWKHRDGILTTGEAGAITLTLSTEKHIISKNFSHKWRRSDDLKG